MLTLSCANGPACLGTMGFCAAHIRIHRDFLVQEWGEREYNLLQKFGEERDTTSVHSQRDQTVKAGSHCPLA